MRDLTWAELQDAPGKVRLVYLYATTGLPIGAKISDEAIDECPEYFQDEVAYRREYASYPQEVHDAYMERYLEIHRAFMDTIPPSLGIVGFARNPDAAKEFHKALKLIKPTMDQRLDELFHLYYPTLKRKS